MSKRMQTVLIVLVVGGLALAACNTGAATDEGDTFVPVVVDDFNVIAEGRLVPLNYVQLAFNGAGLVADVMAAEGDQVEAGQVLAVLDNEEQLRSNLAAAELSLSQGRAALAQGRLELLSAERALADLNENAEMQAAAAQQAVARAREQLDNAQNDLSYAQNPDVQYYQDRVDDARDALTIAQQNEELTSISTLIGAVDQAQTRFDDMQDIFNQVQDQIDNCIADTDGDGEIDNDCSRERRITVDGVPWTLEDAQDALDDAGNALRQAQLQVEQTNINNTNAVDQAQEDLDDALRDLEWALGGPDAIDLALRQADVAVAQATLADAEREWEKVRNGPNPDDVAQAEARVAQAQALIAQAEAQITQAEAAQVAAQAALDDIELRAPWAGTLAALDLKVGEQVSPGVPVVTLADFGGWKVETDNLTEIEVPDVEVGQAVVITPDALPNLELSGEVDSIGNLFEEKRGDITYTVDIRLKDTDPRLRWGMTVVATFDRPS